MTLQAQARLFELTSRTSGGLDPENLRSKTQAYLLDPNHPQNQGKANWFRQALGFDRNNWSELAGQIRFDQSTASLQGISPSGTRYEQSIPIVGANGRTIDVRFFFERDNNGAVRLITAIPSRR